jgi:hypothetical protein
MDMLGNSGTPETPKRSIFRNRSLYTAIIFAAVICYVAAVFIYRYESNRDYQRRAAQKAAVQRSEEDQAAIEQLGGSELAIRAFYVSPAVIHHGETAQVCYDVANAKTVTLEPPVGEVWPSHDRCLNTSPKESTKYTLTITDASGKSVNQTVELQVR